MVDDVNEEMLQPWADLLSEKGITRQGPIGPYMEKELLRDYNLCLNGEKAVRLLGWKAQVAKMDAEGVRKVVESYKRQNWWP